MANSFEIDGYVVDTLLRDLVGHDRQPSAFLVYLVIWRKTDGGRYGTGPLSLAQLSDASGLSKRSVQYALARLARRKLLDARSEVPNQAPEYRLLTPWRRRGRS